VRLIQLAISALITSADCPKTGRARRWKRSSNGNLAPFGKLSKVCAQSRSKHVQRCDVAYGTRRGSEVSFPTQDRLYLNERKALPAIGARRWQALAKHSARQFVRAGPLECRSLRGTTVVFGLAPAVTDILCPATLQRLQPPRHCLDPSDCVKVAQKPGVQVPLGNCRGAKCAFRIGS
jgi:hypothetical protein